MFPAVLRRRFWCYSCFVVFTTERFMLSLTLLFVLIFFSPVWYCDHLKRGRESWSVYFSCMCMFTLHAMISVLFLSSWRRVWLWLVIVALPGIIIIIFFFIYLFQRLCTSGKQINKCQALTSKVSFQGN